MYCTICNMTYKKLFEKMASIIPRRTINLQQIIILAHHPVTARSQVAITTDPHDAMAEEFQYIIEKYLR